MGTIMETLEKIFGSRSKVRIMRLFLFNPEEAFDIEKLVKKTKISSSHARREISNLQKIGLIKSRTFFREIIDSKKGPKRKKVSGWILNPKFPFLEPLQNFLIHVPESEHSDILEKLKKVGVIKLVIMSGVFIQDWESRVDLLIVGDKLKKNALQTAMSDIESDLGKDLKYSFFETSDFLYRLGMCDKLIRDILDYPHRKVINKLELA